jgi:hypothetical protein
MASKRLERHTRWFCAVALIAVLGVLCGCGTGSPNFDPSNGGGGSGGGGAQSGGHFTPTGSMADIHVWHSTTLLPDGKVLVACGIGGVSSLSDLPEAELFNPATGTFTSFAAIPRNGCTATLLPNGKILLTGGMNKGQVSDSAELFDSTTGLFQPAGNMTSPRAGHTATMLSDGTVLIVGGSYSGAFFTNGEVQFAGVPNSAAVFPAEIYDPAAGTFTATGSLLAARAGQTATLLRSGHVLIAGGDAYGSTAELYDPATGAFSATGPMTTLRAGHTATLLPSGQVFIAGGGVNLADNGLDDVMTASTEIYDPATGLFTSAGNMHMPRLGQTATLLRNGTVLLTGGATQDATSFACSTNGAEIYDSAKSVFSSIPNMNQARSAHSATLLADGRVLITGGFHCVVGEPNSFPLNTAEIYQ